MGAQKEKAIKPSVSIRSLPPRLLSSIFLNIVRPLFDKDGRVIQPNFHEHAQPVLPWTAAVHLSLVCRSWRVIALETQELWSYIHTPRLAHAEPILSRSGSLPVVLTIRDQWTLPLALSLAAPRLRELDVFFGDTSKKVDNKHLRTILEQLSSDTPLLETLIFRGDSTYTKASVFPNLVANAMLRHAKPSLRYLSLRDCQLPNLKFPTFNRLARFDIANGTVPIPTVPQLLNALAAMPNLEEFNARLPETGEEMKMDVEDMEPIFLPWLNQIMVTSGLQHSASFFTHFQAPYIMKGRCHLTMSTDESYRSYPTIRKQIVTTLKALGIHRETRERAYTRADLHLDRDEASIFLYPGTDPITMNPLYPTGDDPSLCISFTDEMAFRTETATACVLQYLALEGLQDLSISLKSRGDEALLCSAFLIRCRKSISSWWTIRV
jgi:hypothetical protein